LDSELEYLFGSRRDLEPVIYTLADHPQYFFIAFYHPGLFFIGD